MRKMRIRGQIIDFVEVVPEENRLLVEMKELLRNPTTSHEVKVIIRFLLGEE